VGQERSQSSDVYWNGNEVGKREKRKPVGIQARVVNSLRQESLGESFGSIKEERRKKNRIEGAGIDVVECGLGGDKHKNHIASPGEQGRRGKLGTWQGKGCFGGENATK